MVITFILASTHVTGGHRAVFELANGLTTRGHKVHIVHPLVPLVIKPGINIKDILSIIRSSIGNLIRGKEINWFKVHARNIRILTLYPSFIRLFQKNIPESDVVIATAWETAYAVNKLSHTKGRKTYFIQHYEIWDLWSNEMYWDEAERLLNTGTDWHLAMADLVPHESAVRKIKEIVDATYRFPFTKITTAFWLGQLIESKFGHEAKRITLGVNFSDFNCTPVIKRNEKKTILLSFRNQKWKGNIDALKALSIVKAEFPEININTFGVSESGISADSLNINNYGAVYGENLKELYCSADIFVYPSWFEGWGLPPMEAMACGTACVTTNVGGVQDYAINDVTALVVPPRNPEKIAEAIITLLKDDGKRDEISKAGHDYIQQFTWERTTIQLENILQEICA
ncbi:MAG: glycosyltransferase family 1 protein [Nitrospiraceae bacterium]|nr:MAG: glycosyltransferase family 1 protein [Nitrospiraceae bacterium]